MSKHKIHLGFILLLIVFGIVFYFAGHIILPFLLALGLAFLANPTINRINKVISNRNLAIATFLLSITISIVGMFLILGNAVKNDVIRFNHAFVLFAEDNKEVLNETEQEIKSYISAIYSKTEIEINNAIETVADTTDFSSLSLSSEMIGKSLNNITSFFNSSSKNKKKNHYNWFVILFTTIGYFLTIIYTFNYFETRIKKYFSQEVSSNRFLSGFLNEINHILIKFIKQRSKIVFICMIILIASFSLIGIPGAIILGVIAGLLCYVAHFHYLILIPASLCCWVLSIEQDWNFFIIFGLVLLVLVIVSILEEIILFPKIMGKVSNMNPAIVSISIVFWGFVFGTLGIIIAIPLTSIIMIYVKKILQLRIEEK